MSTLGNVIWIIFGGFLLFLEYVIGGVLLCLTIIGIPFGLQVFKISVLALTPFGLKPMVTDTSSGCLAAVMNVIWILVGGIWIALTHLILGLLFCITIIGIPFGMQHFKLMAFALTPFGKGLASS